MSVVEVDVAELDRLRELVQAYQKQRDEVAERRRAAQRKQEDPHSESWYEKRQKFLNAERDRLARSLMRNRLHGGRYVRPHVGAQVAAYLEYAMVEWVDESTARTPARKRQERLDKKRARNGKAPRKPKRQGHPRKHYAGDDIDPAKRPLREVIRLVRQETERAEDIADYEGILKAAAEKAIPTLLRDFGLDEKYRDPLKQWVTWKFGQVLEQPDIEGMFEWISKEAA